MLVMLCGSGEECKDSIEYIFKDSDFEKYWKELTDDIENCPIIFFYLPLSEFKLTDDLYIKMNARGEHLADYENLKADLIKYIEAQSKLDKKWKKLLDPKTGFPIKFDTCWTDIFWNNKNEESAINEIYFAFINRFFLEFYLPFLTKDEDDPIYKYFAADEKISYTNIDNYKINNKIDYSIFEALINTLDNYAASNVDFDLYAPWDKEFKFIPIYDKESEETKKIQNTSDELIYKVKEISQLRRVVHYAVCKYFSKGKMENDANLKQWMRFVWNLVSEYDGTNPSIRNVSAMRSAIKLIDEIKDPHKVYEELATFDICKLKTDKTGKIESRFIEECHKAQQIFDPSTKKLKKYDGALPEFKGKNWEDVLKEVEAYCVFKGYIPFLYYNEVAIVNWKDFDTKWENIKKYFSNESINTKYSDKCALLKTFISYFDKWDYFLDLTYDNNIESWKKILFEEKWRPMVHKLLITSQLCDTKQYSSVLQNNALIQNQLVKTKLLESIYEGHYIIEYEHNIYLHIYHDYHSNDIYLGDSFHENKLLASFSDSEIKARRITGTDFYQGKDISFEYQNRYFKWRAEKKELVLCKNQNYDSREQDEYGHDIAEEYVQESISKQEFIDKLNSLINKLSS